MGFLVMQKRTGRFLISGLLSWQNPVYNPENKQGFMCMCHDAFVNYSVVTVRLFVAKLPKPLAAH